MSGKEHAAPRANAEGRVESRAVDPLERAVFAGAQRALRNRAAMLPQESCRRRCRHRSRSSAARCGLAFPNSLRIARNSDQLATGVEAEGGR